VIQRIALHQSRFRIGGLALDARGIAIGPVAGILLPSFTRLVGFLRTLGTHRGLDELTDSLEVAQVLSPLRTRELYLQFQTSSSQRMDHLASIARTLGGYVFTGAGRHMVKYRDTQAPVGYDAAELLDSPADLVLYESRVTQGYTREHVLSLREILLRVPLEPAAHTISVDSELIHGLIPTGLAREVLSYLVRRGVDVRVSRLEWPTSDAPDAVERAVFAALHRPSRAIVQWLDALPGARWFVPDGPACSVERAYEHPLPLSSFQRVFNSNERVLFRAGGLGPVLLDPCPAEVSARTITDVSVPAAAPPVLARAAIETARVDLPLSLAPSLRSAGYPSAAIVDLASVPALSSAIRRLPAAVTARASLAFTTRALYLHGAEAVSAMPFGLLMEDLGDDVFVPLGRTLHPAMDPATLRALLGADEGTRLFVTDAHPPVTAVRLDGFVSVARAARVQGLFVSDDSLVDDEALADRALPDLVPDAVGLFDSPFDPPTQSAPSPRRRGEGSTS